MDTVHEDNLMDNRIIFYRNSRFSTDSSFFCHFGHLGECQLNSADRN